MIDKEILIQKYHIEGMTAREVGKLINRSDTQVRFWCKKYNIPIHPRGGTARTKSLKNLVFGRLTVIKQAKGNGITACWECRCECNNVITTTSKMLREGDKKTCGKCRHYNWQGFGDISGHYFATLRTGAKKRKISFNISINEIWNLFLKQNKRCALTGILLVFSKTYGKDEQTASLDRIDNNKGYELNNIQWVHKDINRIKREYNQDTFLKYVQLIAKNLDL